MTDATEGEKDNIWDRLRRRKVVQWGIAYAAGAWGFLQGLAYVSSLLEWPDQLQKLTGLALLIGLPVVLVIAWFHGDRGHRRVTRTELAILTLLFLLGGGLFWRYQHLSETATAATAPASIAPAAITDGRSIAVLPFVNMSSDKEQEYFSDGISEELLNLLAQVPELRVIARTSSFSFKDKDVDIAEIAKKLNVAHVLEGSVRKSGDTLRITAQLIRTADSTHLWSQTYDRQMTDVFAVQDEIAATVVSELKMKLLGGRPSHKQTDPGAYALLLQARAVGRRYTGAAFNESIRLYQEALTLDPAYAMAWIGLASTYATQVTYLQRPADEGYRLAREATANALTYDPTSADVQAMLGWIAIDDRDLATAARHIERALIMDPGNADNIGLAGVLMRRLGRMDQAVTFFEYQVELDPLNADAHDALGYAYRYAGRLDDAIAQFHTALGLSPNYIGGHAAVGELLLEKGDAARALAEMRLEKDLAYGLPGLSMALHALGRKTESDAVLTEMIQKQGSIAPYGIAMVFAYRGEADRAFEWLERAARYRDPLLGSIVAYRMFDPVRSDPRWLPFLRKNGMAPEQLAAIKFDVKSPD